MTSRAKPSRYSTVAVVLHWLIAAIIAGQIALGWRMDEFEGLGRTVMLQVHKTVGIAILVLSVARLAWRLANPPPPHPAGLSRTESWLSVAVHRGFYAALLALPLTGWAMSSLERAGGLRLFSGLTWPAFPLLNLLPGGAQDGLAEAMTNTHAMLVWVMLAMMALHIAGAAKHQFISRDQILARMAPGVGPGPHPRLVAIPAALAVVAAMVYLPRPPQAAVRTPPKSLAQADIYLDIVGPALERRCASCHGEEQSRGGLSLEGYEAVMRGGRGGAEVLPRDADHSPLIKRMLLPHNEEGAMPKGDRPKMGQEQIAAIKVWIDAGAPRGPVGSLKLSPAQVAVLQQAMPKTEGEQDDAFAVAGAEPLPVVPAADPQVVTRLEAEAFNIRRVANTTNLLVVDYVSPKPISDPTVAELAKIGPQILNLNLNLSGLTDAQLKTIAGFRNLRVLKLQRDPVTDAGVAELARLPELRQLVLSESKVTDAALPKLASLKRLESVYVWSTGATPAGVERFKAEHKGVKAVAGLRPEDVPKNTILLQPVN
jgi:cytochrome b561